MNAHDLTPAAFVDAWLAAVKDVKNPDGWVGIAHMASRLGVDGAELVAWCYANQVEAGLEIRGVASRVALVRVAARANDLVRALGVTAVVVALFFVLFVGSQVLA